MYQGMFTSENIEGITFVNDLFRGEFKKDEGEEQK